MSLLNQMGVIEMTYKELAEAIEKSTETVKNQTVTILDTNGEFYEAYVCSIEDTLETDLLDKGHIFLRSKFYWSIS